MKRSTALTSLARDHHQTLVVAQILRRATDQTAQDARARFLAHWDDDAREHLDAGASAFGHLDVHLDGVTGTEVGDVATERGLVDEVELAHDCTLSAGATGRPRCG